MSEHSSSDRLPDDLIHYLRKRQEQNRDLCPKCGKRKQEVPETGWCHPCTSEKRDRERARKRRSWEKHGRRWRHGED